jgi:hypothetical protein
MSGYIISAALLTIGVAYAWIQSHRIPTIDGIPPVEMYITSFGGNIAQTQEIDEKSPRG